MHNEIQSIRSHRALSTEFPLHSRFKQERVQHMDAERAHRTVRNCHTHTTIVSSSVVSPQTNHAVTLDCTLSPSRHQQLPKVPSQSLANCPCSENPQAEASLLSTHFHFHFESESPNLQTLSTFKLFTTTCIHPRANQQRILSSR